MRNRTMLRLFFAVMVVSAFLASRAIAEPTFELDLGRGEIVTKNVVPTGSTIKIRFNRSANLPKNLGVAITGSNDHEPITIKDNGKALWTLIGPEQQEQVALLRSQKIRIVVGKFVPKTKMTSARVNRWGAETCTPHGEIFECEFKEPVAPTSETGAVSLDIKVAPPPF